MKKCRSVELARNAFVVFLGGVGWTLQTSQVSVTAPALFMFDRISCYCYYYYCYFFYYYYY